MTSLTATPTDASITIRPARPEDEEVVRRLARLDAARVPTGDVLIAEVDGVPRAAMAVLDLAYVADPFVPTRELVGLLAVRARRVRGQRHGAVTRARARLSAWSALWQRASVTHRAQ